MLHLREAWATVPLDRKNKTPIPGMAPANHRKSTMTITATQLKEIRQEFATLKPASVTLEGNRVMSVKEAVFVLAPTLERMRKRGFDTQEIVERLHEKGIDVKPQTLTKYLTEARRQREGRKSKMQDTPPHPPKREQRSSFITPDIPDDEL